MKPEKDPEYTTLKKRMREDFRAIRKSVKRDSLPPADAVASFLADSAKMFSFPGKGDEYYYEYMKSVGEFKIAWEAKDLAQLKARVAKLRQIKETCHERYK